jgi:hypothetical protein
MSKVKDIASLSCSNGRNHIKRTIAACDSIQAVSDADAGDGLSETGRPS